MGSNNFGPSSYKLPYCPDNMAELSQHEVLTDQMCHPVGMWAIYLVILRGTSFHDGRLLDDDGLGTVRVLVPGHDPRGGGAVYDAAVGVAAVPSELGLEQRPRLQLPLERPSLDVNLIGYFFKGDVVTKHLRTLQGSPKECFPGLVNFVTAVAYHFCLNLPENFLQPGAPLLSPAM